MRRLFFAGLASLLVGPALADSLSFNFSNSDNAQGTPALTAYPGTIATWSYVTNSTNTNSLIGIYASGSTHRWDLLRRSDANSGTLRQTCNDGTSRTSDGGAVTANAWHHVSFALISATSRNASLDGAAVFGSVTSCTPASLDRFTVGLQANATPANPLGGLSNVFASWSIALSQEEMSALANGWSPRRIQWVAEVKFVPHASTGRDWFGNNMTITGAVASADGPPVALP